MAELADAADSKSAEVHPSWGFNSPSRHQLKSLWIHTVQFSKDAEIAGTAASATAAL